LISNLEVFVADVTRQDTVIDGGAEPTNNLVAAVNQI
jgi:hypothetical protein